MKLSIRALARVRPAIASPARPKPRQFTVDELDAMTGPDPATLTGDERLAAEYASVRAVLSGRPQPETWPK